MLSSTFYDGQGFWLGAETPLARKVCVVAEREGGCPAAGSAPGAVAVSRGQPGDDSSPGVAQSELREAGTKDLRSVFSMSCCGYGRDLALPRPRDHEPADCLSPRVHSSSSQ